MIDRTQEDINQDIRIANLEQIVRELRSDFRSLAGHESRLKSLESAANLIDGKVSEIKAQADGALISFEGRVHDVEKIVRQAVEWIEQLKARL